ncbi:hypothetical protein HHL22_16550 [Hymenobacter sp. RP-2-7]|uniref:Uncharacterized protein n=1 Tax=Hymenobacter polaris TaxID=2682546 RepID=A0A7Y0AGC2_9BACT|nr:hypothetical protein [Hymenobacter polaris]NML66817.1 hypothetical protein [Hymenobacter polaris]
MAAIDWNSLSSATDWEEALGTLTQDAAAAKAGTPADRQAVESELTNFWVIPCPFTKKTDRARQLYNELVLIDLSRLIDQATLPPPTTARLAAATSPRPLGLPETKLAHQALQALNGLREQHRQQLAAHLAMAWQISALQAAVQALLPAPRPMRGKRPAK